MAEITNVTSEALQAKIRQLLPSQQGFGEDLQAQNVIVPIIDLTETASGSAVRQDLQTAIDFSSTPFAISNATSTILTGQTGFWQIEATFSGRTGNSHGCNIGFSIRSGGVTKIISQLVGYLNASQAFFVSKRLVVYMRASDELLGFATGSVASQNNGSLRQIADINGVLVNPNGFTPQ